MPIKRDGANFFKLLLVRRTCVGEARLRNGAAYISRDLLKAPFNKPAKSGTKNAHGRSGLSYQDA
uniref:Uncharacterized protein n=1 Tax=Arundo donax TaxID=35708 RepID=A0A0A9A3C9_ARUDO